MKDLLKGAKFYNSRGHVSVGPLGLTLHKTVRVPAGETPSALPPSLGYFEILKVRDYRELLPQSWDEDGLFIVIDNKEAMWIDFRSSTPCAVSISAGGVNAINGERSSPVLESEGYVTVPPQPWLDGWKDKDGKVYQFCGTEYKKGDGLTVAEQIIGDESSDGSLEIKVFELIDPEARPREDYPYSHILNQGEEEELPASVFCGYLASPVKSYFCSTGEVPTAGICSSHTEMGLGKGGAIEQKIYPDPYGLPAWKNEAAGSTKIYMINSNIWPAMTKGMVVDASDYNGPWFGLKDKELGDSGGSPKFKEIASISDAEANET